MKRGVKCVTVLAMSFCQDDGWYWVSFDEQICIYFQSANGIVIFLVFCSCRRVDGIDHARIIDNGDIMVIRYAEFSLFSSELHDIVTWNNYVYQCFTFFGHIFVYFLEPVRRHQGRPNVVELLPATADSAWVPLLNKEPETTMHQKKESEVQRRRVYEPELSSMLSK